jgi:transposase
MISVSAKHRIFLAIEPIDFRKGIDSIARLCQHQFHQDPMTGHYFIFRNKRKTDIKLLYYDSQGFCLYQKRLSTGRFRYWPTADNPLITLTPAQLQVLLYNGDPQATQECRPWRPIDESINWN